MAESRDMQFLGDRMTNALEFRIQRKVVVVPGVAEETLHASRQITSSTSESSLIRTSYELGRVVDMSQETSVLLLCIPLFSCQVTAKEH